MASHNALLKSESKPKLIQVSTSTQTQHFSSLELLLDSYMPEIALSSKSGISEATRHLSFSLTQKTIPITMTAEVRS
jgi:hypothetical protein